MPFVDVNRPRFLRLAYKAATLDHARYNIGTYKEKTLHLVLKNYFSESRTEQEVSLSGYIADIYRTDKGIIEIQTSGFASMKDKLEAFLPLYPVTIVYPIPKVKWVSWIEPESGEIGKRNRSPKTGKLFDVIPELIFIKDYLKNPNLTVRAVLLEIDEYRMLNGRRSRSRKRGSTRFVRIPVDLFEIYDFKNPADYISLLPFDAAVEFTASELSSAFKFRGRDVSAMIRVLMEVGAIERIGKRGRSYVYRISDK